MFNALRSRTPRRINATTVIAVLALVFAMTGGAYAASKVLITSTKQISPKVLKALKGARGAAGAQGAAGPAGAAGPQGSVGAGGSQGPAGAAGAKGETGPAGAPGKEGKEGKEGSPWTANGTLPSEATETGVWRFISNGESEQFVPISFPIPLSGADAESIAVESLSKTASPTANCPGTAGEPRAEPGFLCVYTSAFATNMAFGNPAPGTPAFKPGSSEEEGVIAGGTLLYFETAAVGALSSGSFAVTAP